VDFIVREQEKNQITQREGGGGERELDDLPSILMRPAIVWPSTDLEPRTTRVKSGIGQQSTRLIGSRGNGQGCSPGLSRQRSAKHPCGDEGGEEAPGLSQQGCLPGLSRRGRSAKHLAQGRYGEETRGLRARPVGA
jgi:hypothetical protein